MSKTTGLSKSKSISIMLVVIACFSVLWPKIFYPMIMCGLNWSTDQAERAHNDRMLPAKVRDAMRSNPSREATKVERLPGRPEFYTGHRAGGQIAKGAPSSSMMNLMLPVFTIIITLFFIYTMLKMPFSSDDSGHNESTSRKRRTLKPELNTLPSDTKEICQQRNRHLPVSQLGYQAVGGQNLMQNLIRDIETFRDHLKKAEVCACKMQKYDSTSVEAKVCAEDVTDAASPNEHDKEESSHSEIGDIIETVNISEHKIACSNEEEAQTEKVKQEVKLCEQKEKEIDHAEKEDQENAPSSSKDNTKLKENQVKWKHRKWKPFRKLYRIGQYAKSAKKEKSRTPLSDVVPHNENQEMASLSHLKHD